MAKAKVRFPLDSIEGSIQGNDRTIGRDKGLASALRKINAGVAGDKNNQPKTQLYARTPVTRGGSKNRHSRAERYCECDHGYSYMGWPKISYLRSWWQSIRERPDDTMSAYHIYMKICLKYMAELAAFGTYSWCSRYFVKNNSDVAWTNKVVVLTDIPTNTVDGADLEVFLLLNYTTTKNRITFEPKMIDYRLVHAVSVRGRASVTIPSLQPEVGTLVDVYSYIKGV